MLLLALFASVASAAGPKHYITGQVIDRNGQPVDRAIISLSPGNVQLVTDREGKFLIDYLRDGESGERIKLAKKTDYAVEVFKPGFHVKNASFFFKKKVLLLETFTLVEETIEIKDDGADLDPGIYADKTHSSGANYEGQ